MRIKQQPQPGALSCARTVGHVGRSPPPLHAPAHQTGRALAPLAARKAKQTTHSSGRAPPAHQPACTRRRARSGTGTPPRPHGAREPRYGRARVRVRPPRPSPRRVRAGGGPHLAAARRVRHPRQLLRRRRRRRRPARAGCRPGSGPRSDPGQATRRRPPHRCDGRRGAASPLHRPKCIEPRDRDRDRDRDRGDRDWGRESLAAGTREREVERG